MIEINCIGDICPLPVIKIKKTIEANRLEERFTAFVDNEIATQNLGKLAKEKGYNTQVIKDAPDKYRVIFHKKPGSAYENNIDLQTAEEYKNKEKGQHFPVAVVISSDKMGDGDDKLGQALIKGFIYALAEGAVVPDTIIFYNKGAILSAKGSDSLEDLRKLTEKGACVLTCGACIDFYGLNNKPAIGEVTNMYEIAEKLMTAGKIIKP